MERAAAREETARVQQEIMNLLTEKQVLDSSHSHMHNLCQKLEAELSLLQREKTQALEQHSQVRDIQSISHFSLFAPSSPSLGERGLLIAGFTELVVALKFSYNIVQCLLEVSLTLTGQRQRRPEMLINKLGVSANSCEVDKIETGRWGHYMELEFPEQRR